MARRQTRGQDPYWITARFTSQCARCQEAIRPGAPAFYYPNTRSIYCEAPSCGKACSREFDGAKQDEEFYNSQSRYGGYSDI